MQALADMHSALKSQRRPPERLRRADKDDPPVMATLTGEHTPHALVAPSLLSTAVLERELEQLRDSTFDRQVRTGAGT